MTELCYCNMIDLPILNECYQLYYTYTLKAEMRHNTYIEFDKDKPM